VASSHPSPVDHLVLAEGDNIAVALRSLAPGEAIAVAGERLVLRDSISQGHKFALVDIPEGDPILKYAIPIGRATRGILAGESVHTHNLASDYLPTYALDAIAPSGAPAKGEE